MFKESWSRGALLTVALCAIAGGVDSFDTQMIGFTGRLIANDLRFPTADLGWLFGAGQLGGIVGAILFGSLADRAGRVKMLIITCLLAAAFTFASLSAHNFRSILVLRTLTGVGLGGVLPCFLGLGVQAMPPRARVTATPILYASFPLGGVLGAWISAPLITAFGWRGVFAFAASALVVIGLLVGIAPVPRHAPGTPRQAGRISSLLAGRLANVTWPLWGVFLLAPPGVYLLVLWMPPLLQLLGVSAERTSLLIGFLNAGALGLALVGGWVVARFGPMRTLGPILLLGSVSFAALALTYRDFPTLVAVSIVAGAALGGSMALLVSMAAMVYPEHLRATGIGFALGVARIGQMSAPIPIGLLLGAHVSPRVALAACGLPPMMSLIALFILNRALRDRAAQG